MRLNLDLKEKCADKNWAHFLSCSPDPITNSETTNSHLIGSKIHDQSEFLILELVFGSGEQER